MQIESSRKCQICNRRFTNDGLFQPKILKCGHTLCTNCIWKISTTFEVKCPFCYGLTHIGVLGPFALPVNRTLVDLCEVNLQNNVESGDASVDFCNYCNKNPAEKICFDCHSLGYKLCENCCINEHSRPFAPVLSHEPLNIKEVTKSPKYFCGEHKQLLTYYSEKAAKYACKRCLEELSDVDMEFLPIDVVTQTLKQNLLPIAEKLEGYLKRLQISQHKIEHDILKGQLGKFRSKAMKEIQMKFTKYQIICQERLKELLFNVENEVSDVYVTYP